MKDSTEHRDDLASPCNFHAEFVDRLRLIVPHNALTAVLESFAKPRVVGLRINTLKAAVAEVLNALAGDGLKPNAVSWSPTAFWVPGHQRELATHSPLVSDGKLYIQSLSSQLAPILLDPQPNESILDLAAAPGGKTTHLAALMENRGTLAAVEPIRDRFFRLRATLDRLGVTNCKTYMKDGRTVGKKTGPRFDRVLLDAPCTAESRMRTDQVETMHYWSRRKIRESSRKQRGLIESAFTGLKPGGRLLYCTCTFAPEENEQIVADLLGKFPDTAELESLRLPIPNVQPGLTMFGDTQYPEVLARTVRILPNEIMDSFYLAMIRKTA